MKRDKIIAIIVVVVLLIPISFIIYSVRTSNQKQSNPRTINKTDSSTAASRLEYGINFYGTGNYENAITNLNYINEKDSLYPEAQKYIVLCNERFGTKEKINNISSKSNTIKQELEKYGNTWQEQFINYRETYNSDVKKLIIDQSVLYIYLNRIKSDYDFIAKMYTVQFQKVYHENTGKSYVGTLVYYNNRLIKEYSADNNGLK